MVDSDAGNSLEVDQQLSTTGRIRVACGTTAPYTDSAGNVWLADTGATGGTALSPSATGTIHGTTDQKLYMSERWGSFSYNFAVPNGTYAVNLKFAETFVTGSGQRKFNVAINGTTVLSNFDIFAAAGGGFLPVDEQFPISVTNGAIRIDFTPGAIQSPKVDAIQIMSSAVTTVNTEVPFFNIPAQVPGRIAAVNYDLGGEGVAYHTQSSANKGGYYRNNEAIGIAPTNDAGGGFEVGWLETGSWLRYTVYVSHTGTYTLSLRVAAGDATGALHVEVDGANLTGSLHVPQTGAWSPAVWTTLTATVSLTAGKRVLRVVTDAQNFNINWIALAPSGVPPSTSTGTTSGLPGNFFGMTQTLLGGTHNITVPAGILRLWNTNCTWNFTETGPDTYDFTNCDAWFDYAAAISASPVFVMGRTPSWAISGGAGSCTGVFAPNGCAQLPSDVAGANTILTNFITALATRVKARHPTLRWGIEGLNEADLAGECAGAVSGHCAMADLVKYQHGIFTSAHAVDANITVYGPAAATFNPYGAHLYGPQMGSATCPGTGCAGSGFLLAGGGAYIDAVNLHPYFWCGAPNFCQTPEAGGILAALAAVHSTLNSFGLSNLPIVLSETDWGSTNTNNVLTSDQKTEYFARELVYAWDDGMAGMWWYSWDCNTGNMETCWGTWFVNGSPLPVVTAYNTARQWLLGSNHIVRSCNHNVDGHDTWSCPFTTSAGAHSQILMNGGGSQTVSVPGFTRQFNLDGTSSAIAGSEVTVGLKPIMIQ
jgi:hypothetical protein